MEFQQSNGYHMHQPFAPNGCPRAHGISSQLDFLSTTDVGRLVPAEVPAEEDGSEVSEWECREHREREEERRMEAEELERNYIPL